MDAQKVSVTLDVYTEGGVFETLTKDCYPKLNVSAAPNPVYSLLNKYDCVAMQWPFAE